MFFYNRIRGCEPETVALFLCGKERIEDVAYVLIVNADAGVGNA